MARSNRGGAGKSNTFDLHPADIVAMLRKRGLSLRELSRRHGYSPGTLKEALRRPYPKAERLIARALRLTPESLWPSRYAARAARKRA